MSLRFTQPNYDIREYAYLRLVVTNVGAGPAPYITLTTTGPATAGWEYTPNPWVLEPGASTEIGASVPLDTVQDAGPLTMTVTAHPGAPDAEPVDNTAGATTMITYRRAGFSGTAFGDLNRDGVRQPTEGIAGAQVTATGGRPAGTYRARTGPDGRYAFDDIPAGNYTVTAEAAGGWLFEPRSVDIDAGQGLVADLRGTRHLSEVLAVTMGFDHETNRVAERAPLTISLTNRGPLPLTRLRAWCVGSDWDSDWGPLHMYGEGLTLAPAATAVVHARMTIPLTARPGTEYRLVCRFDTVGPGPASIEASAVTRVTPGLATLSGDVYENEGFSISCWPLGITIAGCGYPSFHPKPGIRLYLADPSGKVAARAVSDDLGRFEFPPVVPGKYTYGIVGPWKIARRQPHDLDTLVVGPNNLRLWIEPGPEQREPSPPPLPAKPTVVPPRQVHVAHPTPAPPSDGAGDLARTGVDAAWSTAIGLVAVLFGALLVRRGRRSTR
ncbi:carboxypeptidase-like regulatory domain-containing protein [Actinokineospora auranticolor]|uniref:Carboxypeptidase family protein n=1 Tax=Actinokineospora auranticolor TaxID=155976 RepID=A0A2S6GQ50_9PSEU|nr:carboxypeptidase-like regulatory domain-containing protein [Actinokineospora auranticolor]PPK67241.1 carboxypeptidase family protein [Actinokineospora auranticolor]